MQKIRFLTATLILILASLASFAAKPAASQVLNQLRQKMSAPAVEVFFTIYGAQQPVQGSATLSGAKLAMTTPEMCIWYDGTTQWTYLASNREVNISEPSAAELLVSNPFAILSADTSEYKARRLSDAAGCDRISLSPADTSAGIVEIVVAVDKNTHWPKAVTVTFDDQRKIEMSIDRINAAKTKPAGTFRYNKAAYPADEIIDLR